MLSRPEAVNSLLPLEGGGQEEGVTDIGFTLPFIPCPQGRGNLIQHVVRCLTTMAHAA
jgi:hypothetical protein